MKYGVAIFPSKNLQDKANSYRKRYDPHYALIPPHITIKGAFEASDTEIKNVAEKLSQISSDSKPFTLNVLKVSSFQPVNNTIYFKVELTPELKKLHETLHSKDFFKSINEYAFVPHITIGQQLSDDEHSDVFGQSRMLDVTHSEEVDRFHLLYQLENGSWSVHETFILGKE
ncbi:YjcG family protein [Bacillus sp. CECT 9360]|uniref:YjcG family protein n=1 Tax=Bacillus sp. CECT 9360 TaxID=2845821 RepID=UPI001E31901D|nr:YjcG family protein [Bacillus sp. CECT 9360]CAH0344517.1 Putative phosphoesterase YjcG [Bacillus sp. CECT 9360]